MNKNIIFNLYIGFVVSFLTLSITSCENDLWEGYKKIKLNEDDHRFENEKDDCIYNKVEGGYSKPTFFFERNDSTFIYCGGYVLYPIKLPHGYGTFFDTFYFSGISKVSINGIKPLILTELGFKD